MCQLRVLLLLLHLLLVACSQVASNPSNKSCFQSINYETILQNVQLPSCMVRQKNGSDCSALQHLRKLAEERKQDLHSLIQRSSLVLFASKGFQDELTVPGNPGLDVEDVTRDHLGFIAVTRCIVGENFCPNIRKNCGAKSSSRVYLISGHCSDTIRCISIASNFEKGKPTALLSLMDYIKFILLERQLFIAKEMGEVNLSISERSEYLIQAEINEAHNSSLLQQNRPVAVFIPWPERHIAYYYMFSMFIDSALRLKSLFNFHVITAPLTFVEDKKSKPIFSKNLQEQKAYLLLYTQKKCENNENWAFTCEPAAVGADGLLTEQQFVAFLLNQMLELSSLKAPFPAFNKANDQLEAFISLAGTYAIGVVPVEEMLTDPFVDWEGLKMLTSYLTSSFTVKYYPIILTAKAAIELMKDMNTGLDLEKSLELPCYLIRFPGSAGYTILAIEQPVVTLDPIIRSIEAKTANVRRKAQESLEYLDDPSESRIPEELEGTGHFARNRGASAPKEDVKELLDGSVVDGRIDAFVEQLNLKEFYNVSGIKVVETDAELLSKFTEIVGRDKPWLVAFIVSWSPLSKAARTIWAAVRQCVTDIGMHDVQFAKVDCFEANGICNSLGIQTYPTIAMYHHGKQLANYSGPIAMGRLCQFANLVLQDPVIRSESDEQTIQLTKQFLPLNDRVFVFKGSDLPASLVQLAQNFHPYELFIHQRVDSGEAKLIAKYKNIYPNEHSYQGSLDKMTELRNFVRNGYLNSVFPCSWRYLPQALALNKSLVILMHLTLEDNHISVLQHLQSQFASEASFCNLHLQHTAYLNDLIHRIGGANIPSLVALVQPPKGAKQIHRLQLGPIASNRLQDVTSDWVQKALRHQLHDGNEVAPLEEWRPATAVYNFVKEVYDQPAEGSGRKTAKVIHEEQDEESSDRFENRDTDFGADGELNSPIGQTDQHSSGLLHEEL